MAVAQKPAVTLRQLLAGFFPAGWIVEAEGLDKILPLGEKFSELLLELGYLHIQGTKPDTIGRIWIK